MGIVYIDCALNSIPGWSERLGRPSTRPGGESYTFYIYDVIPCIVGYFFKLYIFFKNTTFLVII